MLLISVTFVEKVCASNKLQDGAVANRSTSRVGILHIRVVNAFRFNVASTIEPFSLVHYNIFVCSVAGLRYASFRVLKSLEKKGLTYFQVLRLSTEADASHL